MPGYLATAHGVDAPTPFVNKNAGWKIGGNPMVDTYTIYVVNQSTNTQVFWCFMARPQELANDPGVFANSSASSAVQPNDPGMNYFQIPLQYQLGAGAGNRAVGLNVEIVSNVTNNVLLQQAWEADYATVPPNRGPTMRLTGDRAPSNAIAISTSAFDKFRNESSNWFATQTFGLQTALGFVGMTWSPYPGQMRTLTPVPSYYIAAGPFGSNALASWVEVANLSIEVSAPADFQFGNCTVTYLPDGSWSKRPGRPQALENAGDLDALHSERPEKSRSSSDFDAGRTQVDVLVEVHWNSSASDAADFTYLTGSIRVANALDAGFSFFVLSGVVFSCGGRMGSAAADFIYSGPMSVEHVKSLFVAGARLYFGGAS